MELSLTIPGWENRSKPLKVAVLADIHLGSHTNDTNRLAEIVIRVNQWKPDVTLLLGDFMNTQIFGGGRIPPTIISQLLRPLNSRLGSFAVLGNHDWDYDGFAVWQALEEQEIAVLENASRVIGDEFGDFQIIGLADQKTRQPDIDLAFKNCSGIQPALVMAHDPATFASIPNGPYLTLCGHTHGGQCRLPYFGPVVNASQAPLKWSAGYVVEEGRHLFVSRGIGTSTLPLRINCRPEICLLTIKG